MQRRQEGSSGHHLPAAVIALRPPVDAVAGIAASLAREIVTAGSSDRIVDLLAIRRDHSERPGFPRGDLFELILVQVKGGASRMATQEDVKRLKAVAKVYRARSVVLAAWKKGRAPTFFVLARKGWVGTDVRQLF